jgi:hypothetical protein
VDREGEDAKYRKFIKGSKIENRMLLWHGSRVTNFVGILSQGLRIAPPEAPVTGYMFGKGDLRFLVFFSSSSPPYICAMLLGIYFADMSSKSANYCFATKENPFVCFSCSSFIIVSSCLTSLPHTLSSLLLSL